MATHSRIPVWETYGQRTPAGNSPWGRKESNATEQAHKRHKCLPRNTTPALTSLRRAQFESCQCDSRSGSVVPGPAALAFPGSELKIQNLTLHLRPTDSASDFFLLLSYSYFTVLY